MSKRDERDVANALLVKARGDEAGLRALAGNPDVPDHVAGFLAQQAIELGAAGNREVSEGCSYSA